MEVIQKVESRSWIKNYFMNLEKKLLVKGSQSN